MSIKRIFVTSTLGLFVFIAVLGMVKKGREKNKIPVAQSSVQEVEFDDKNQPVQMDQKILHTPIVAKKTDSSSEPNRNQDELPSANYIESFFDPAALKLPIVQTVVYSSRVPWLKGKPAWVSDYASYYKTSKHFIARSLNRKADYFNQNVKQGDRFNILRMDKNFYFYLLVDLSRCKMWFYYVDQDLDERVLVKTYDLGLGRSDELKASGFLTPMGKFELGEKIAVYRPGVKGIYNNESIEMVKVFGTRWIPFEREVENCSAPAKGFGLHGNPLYFNAQSNEWVEDRSGIGKYTSDGCIRMSQDAMEELFSIVISRPTYIELVRDFNDAKLPGKEKTMNGE